MSYTAQELNGLFSFIPQPIQRKTKYNQQPIIQTSTNNTIDVFMFLSIAFWFITNIYRNIAWIIRELK